jgi:hypothetical protein
MLGLGFPTLREEGRLSRKRRACILGSCQAEMASLVRLVGIFVWLVGVGICFRDKVRLRKEGFGLGLGLGV